MSTEAKFAREGNTWKFTAAAAIVGGQVVQAPDGRAGVVPSAVEAGLTAEAQLTGVYDVLKTADIVLLDGARVFWDHSANTATYTGSGNDADFFIGRAVGDAAASDSTVRVALNETGRNIIDIRDGGFNSVIVKTVVGSTTVEVPNVMDRAGSCYLTFGTTAEAQKVDILSQRGFAPGADWICEMVINIVTASDNAAGDLSFGVASGTHATDADAITESAFFHVDGASTTIYAECDDNTNETNATTTSTTFTAGTPFHLVIDGRDMSSIKYYINGARVASGTTFNASLAAGPLYLLVHAEKTSDDSPLTLRVDRADVRIAKAA